MDSFSPEDVQANLAKLLHQINVNSESEKLRNEIDLTVQVWTTLNGDIVHRQPRAVKLKPAETLFDTVDRIVPCDKWGVVTEDTKVWYIRHTRMEFIRQTAEDKFALLEFSIRNRPPKDIPTILLQDLS